MKTFNYTLPPRIKTRKYFLLATHNGRKFVTKGVLMQIVANNKPDLIRVGFTTTKKLGCAVIRNRVRRRLREVCRLELSSAPRGYDYVFVGRQATIDRPFDGLQKDVRYVLTQFKNELQQKAQTQINPTVSENISIGEEKTESICNTIGEETNVSEINIFKEESK